MGVRLEVLGVNWFDWNRGQLFTVVGNERSGQVFGQSVCRTLGFFWDNLSEESG